MTQFTRDRLCRRHRFPAEVIAQAVWLYFRFPLSLSLQLSGVEPEQSLREWMASHKLVLASARDLRGFGSTLIKAAELGRNETTSATLVPRWHAKTSGAGNLNRAYDRTDGQSPNFRKNAREKAAALPKPT